MTLKCSTGTYAHPCKPFDNRKKFTIVKRFPLVNVNLLTIFIFFTITMAVAQSWLGGIGKYPPHPSRSSNTPLVPRLRLGTSGSIANLSGCGGYFPIPPRHNCAIVPL